MAITRTIVDVLPSPDWITVRVRITDGTNTMDWDVILPPTATKAQAQAAIARDIDAVVATFQRAATAKAQFVGTVV